MNLEASRGSMKTIFSIKDFDLKDQNVFMRVDLNVPLENGKIKNSYRIKKALPSIQYALDQGARVILASHLGRPEGVDPKLSLAPVAEALTEILDVDVLFVEDILNDVTQAMSPSLKKNQLILLENLRFHKGERNNDNELAHALAQNIDIYINDAFGVCHRRHMSLSALPLQVQKKGYGYLIQEELEFLNKIKTNPARPFATVLGGSKVKDKFNLILNLIDQSDTLIIGGSMAYVFLKAQGFSVGKASVDSESLNLAKDLLDRVKVRKKQIFLPKDHIIVPELHKTNFRKTTTDAHIPDGWQAIDIGPQTIESFSEAFKGVQTIFWNGPMGIFEIAEYSEGTKQLAHTIGNQDAFSVVGGGDSARAVLKYGLSHKFDHVSTGGGAALAYIQGQVLPGLDCLQTSRKAE